MRVRLPIARIGRLNDLERTVAPNLWVAEAEDFVFGGELARHARRHREALHLDAIEKHGLLVAVAVSFPDPLYTDTRRIAALVVDQRRRGEGFGTELLQGVVDDNVGVGKTACWLVHPLNVSMLACARRINPTPDEAVLRDGYLMFIAP